MSGINLLPKDKQEMGPLRQVRHWALLVTTIVLVIYLVVVAGLAGWGLFLATQDRLALQGIAKMEAEIRQVSAAEALVWETSKRADLIDKFLQSKSNLTASTQLLIPTENVGVVGYKYNPQSQSVQVRVGQLFELEKYTERLKPKFPKIINSTIEVKDGLNWEVDILL